MTAGQSLWGAVSATRMITGRLGRYLAITLALAGSTQISSAAIFDIPDGDITELRNAIVTANSNGEADTINLAANGLYSFSSVYDFNEGANALPAISSTIVINGNDAVIERSLLAKDEFRLFYVFSPGLLTLNNVTLRGGLARDGEDGGAIYQESNTLVTITSSTLISNAAGQGDDELFGGGWGGAIYAEGDVTITSSVLTGNRAGDGFTAFAPEAPSERGFFFGGPGGNGGAIACSSITEITDTLIEGNFAGDGGDGSEFAGRAGEGGGIFNQMNLSLLRCVVRSNRSGDGGSIFGLIDASRETRGFSSLRGGNGGGLKNEGLAFVTQTEFDDNRTGDGGIFQISPNVRGPVFLGGGAGHGGGICNSGRIEVTECSIHNNSTGFGNDFSNNGSGGGYSDLMEGGKQSPPRGKFSFGSTIVRSTINDNRAYNGGGISVSAEFFVSTIATIENCTISGNSAGVFAGLPQGDASRVPEIDGLGGGIFVDSEEGDAYVQLTHSTVAFNAAAVSGGGYYAQETTFKDDSAEAPRGLSGTVIELGHNILASNTPDNCQNFSASVVSDGYNLSDTEFCCEVGTDICLADPRLEPLGDNGGPTMTHGLGAGSAASDAGDPAFVPPPDTDQRLMPRVMASAIDIGAVEEFNDCNENNIDDNAELTSDTDINENLILDVCETDVAIQKSSTAGTVEVGSTFDYILTAINLGDVATQETTVTDNLPVGLIFVSSIPPPSSGPNPLIYTLPSLAVGEQTTITITVQATADAIGEVINNATIDSVADIALSNNISSSSLTVQDTTPPVVTCPADILTTTCEPSVTVVLGSPEITDQSEIASVVITRDDDGENGDPFSTGTTIVTYTATDASGNSASCTQTVEIAVGDCEEECTEGVDLLTEQPRLQAVRCRTRRGVLTCSIVANVKTRNAGTATSVETRTSFFLSSNQVFDSADIFIGSKGYGPVRPGRTMRTPGRGPLPPGIDPAGMYVLAVADFPGNNVECDELNNVIVVGQVGAPSAPRR